jgi:hypothetical protein
MSQQVDYAAIARGVIGSGLYMVLGTADEAGSPWVSPVYYAHEDYTTFYWVSDPEAQHSRNLAVRPQLGIVIFDSGTRIGSGQGMYMSATAEMLGDDLDHVMDVFSQRTLMHGGTRWTPDDVREPARHRAYRAVPSEQWVLEPGRDRRVPVDLH